METKAKPGYYEKLNIEIENCYVTGNNQLLKNIHTKTPDCLKYGCVIHNPSNHPMKGFPTYWREDRDIMERIDKFGVGHPDPDMIAYFRRTFGDEYASAQAIHGCNGVCAGSYH